MRILRASSIGRVCVRALLLSAIACAAWLASPSTGLTSSFDVDWGASVADTSPSANSDLNFHLDIPAPSANFDVFVNFLPSTFFVAQDEDVPNGALAGTIDADAVLGLVNGSCETHVDVQFQLMEAATDPTFTIPLYAGVNDFDGDGLVENVELAPGFLRGIAPNLQPVQRLYGQVLVAGTWAFVNFLIFEPGAPLPLLPELDPSLGYPTMIILNDPTAPIEPIAITDFCSPLATTTVLKGISADNPATSQGEGGRVLRANPAEAGLYSSTLFARSRWDGDDDGIENQLDPCPYDADPAWDARANATAGDSDQDGLPNSCDPNDAETNTDQDGDGFLNRGDPCARTVEAGFYSPDLDHDGVGDVCDRAPDDPSDGGLNHRHEACITATVQIGAGGIGPPPPVCPSGPDRPIPPRFEAYAPPFVGVGDVLSVGVYVSEPLGYEGIPGIDVHFGVSGAHTLEGQCLTDSGGSCQYNYLGANLGEDHIEITATVKGIDLARTLTVEWLPPPPNDNFADAIDVPGLPFEDEQNSIAAGTETQEPRVCPQMTNTFWYRFEPAADAQLHIEVPSGESSQVFLGAYRGTSIAGLESIACAWPWYDFVGTRLGRSPSSCCAEATTTYLSMPVEAGQTYYFQAGPGDEYFAGETHIEFEALTFGDTNCTKSMDTLDALSILRYTAGFTTDADELECVEYGDLSCDSRVDAFDALLLLRLLAQLAAAVHELCPSGPQFGGK